MTANEALIKKLTTALKDAAGQCRRHNEEYHHSTSKERIAVWEALVEQAEKPKRTKKGKPEEIGSFDDISVTEQSQKIASLEAELRACGQTMTDLSRDRVDLWKENDRLKAIIAMPGPGELSDNDRRVISNALRRALDDMECFSRNQYDAQGNAALKGREEGSSKATLCSVESRQGLEEAYGIIQKFGHREEQKP